jgi:hypothetical protein
LNIKKKLIKNKKEKMKYRTKNFKKRVSREEARRRRYEYKRNNNDIYKKIIIIIIPNNNNIIIETKEIGIGCGSI